MNQAQLFNTILAPHISEKASLNTDKANAYVFRVIQSATKKQIWAAVEQMFNTKVKSVHIVTVKSKQKTFRGKQGLRKSWKKAYVTLQADQKIELIGAQ